MVTKQADTSATGVEERPDGQVAELENVIRFRMCSKTGAVMVEDLSQPVESEHHLLFKAPPTTRLCREAWGIGATEASRRGWKLRVDDHETGETHNIDPDEILAVMAFGEKFSSLVAFAKAAEGGGRSSARYGAAGVFGGARGVPMH